MDVKKIYEAWKDDQPRYEDLGRLVVKFMKKQLPTHEILPEILYRTKELVSIIKKIRKKQRERKYDYADLTDKLGIRIICVFQEDLDKVDEFIKKYFSIVRAEYKKTELPYNKLDYLSNHYDLTLKSGDKLMANRKDFSGLTFEVQVRSLNQHSWANAAHSLSYKREADVPDSLNRKLYRLLSLYEIADDEISSISKALSAEPDGLVFSILKKIEGKFFKFARIDYDRELSVHSIRTILSFLNVKDIEKVKTDLDKFITNNEEKIIQIFDENSIRYHEIAFLSQPEVLLVWFGLERFEFSINDNWSANFPDDDLEMMKTLWGKSI